MSVPQLIAQPMLGLFELDALGKVLYYRMDLADMSPDMTGHNFYDEVAPFENVEEFRQCVTDFTQGEKAADSFDFNCHYNDSDYPIRVLPGAHLPARESEEHKVCPHAHQTRTTP